MNGMHMDELNQKVCGRLVRGEDAAVGCSSIMADTMEVTFYILRAKDPFLAAEPSWVSSSPLLQFYRNWLVD